MSTTIRIGDRVRFIERLGTVVQIRDGMIGVSWGEPTARAFVEAWFHPSELKPVRRYDSN